MKLHYKTENWIERLGLFFGRVPTPMVDTWVAQKVARCVMAATQAGIFEALVDGPLTAGGIAEKCKLSAAAVERFLGVLVTADYLRWSRGDFSLTAKTRKWMLKDNPISLYDNIAFQYLEWKFIEHTEEYLRTGVPIDFHSKLTDAEWGLYQRAMRAIAGTNAAEVVKAAAIPAGATAMLDIGGSHGFYSVALCRAHPGLRAEILDLPEAIRQASGILAKEQMGDRVVHLPGNVLTSELGAARYDAILMSSLVHHFDDAANRAVMKKIAAALKPGGAVTIMDYVRPRSPDRGGQVAWVMNFYFALTSQSGSFSFADIAGWQREAGLAPEQPVEFRTIPGTGLQIARKPL